MTREPKTAFVTRAGLEALGLVCEFKHLARGHYPPMPARHAGMRSQRQRLRIFPIRHRDLLGAHPMGVLNTRTPPMQLFPRRPSMVPVIYGGPSYRTRSQAD